VSSYIWLTNWKTKDSAVVFQEINKRTVNHNSIRTIKVLTEYKMSKYSYYWESVLFSFYLTHQNVKSYLYNLAFSIQTRFLS